MFQLYTLYMQNIYIESHSPQLKYGNCHIVSLHVHFHQTLLHNNDCTTRFTACNTVVSMLFCSLRLFAFIEKSVICSINAV